MILLLQSAEPLINWAHILTEGVIILVPVLGLGYLGYRELKWTLREYRPHKHVEKKEDEVLTVAGIDYPRQFNGDR